MDSAAIILIIVLASLVFLITLLVALRIAFPPVNPFVMKADQREHIVRANRGEKTPN